jgi:Second Messenger Oligonucleotide or Dinucleotide Synthetase domain
MGALFEPFTPSLASSPFFSGIAPAPAITASHQWIAVRQRFEQFHGNLFLTPLQLEDAQTKRAGVVNCLNRHYHDSQSETDNSFMIGSWGKNTHIRPPRDIDLYFILPPAVYYRFQNYAYNRQSALLQEVKNVLSRTYPNTDMSADGQIVLVRFDSYAVEVVPAFLLQSNQYWICHTTDQGSYKTTDPWAEARHIEAIDAACNQNLRPLIRMLKAWQFNSSVPIKSFQLELVAAAFIQQCPWRKNSFFWFDWIIRDFFLYLFRTANTSLTIPGTSAHIFLGDEWQSRTLTAYERAVKACDYERDNLVQLAGEEWQKIFGFQVPRTI